MARFGKIFVFGNPLVNKDSVPISITPELAKEFRDIEFVHFDTAEDLQKEGRELLIIDSVEGMKEVSIIDNVDMLTACKAFSLHDFDLAHTLKLLKKIKAIDRVVVIGIPTKISRKKALIQTKNLLRSILL